MSLFGTSGIRGTVGDVVTAELALSVGRGIGTCKADRIVVGHDPRETSEWLVDVLAACRLTALVDRRGSLDALVDTVETLPIHRENLETESKHDLMDSIRMSVKEEYPDRCSTTDGVYVPFDDGWFLIRPSGTEPVVRLTAEAKTQERTAHLLEQAKEHARPVVSQ